MNSYQKPQIRLELLNMMICQTQSGLAIVCDGPTGCEGKSEGVYTECMDRYTIDGDFVLSASACSSGVIPRIYINGHEVNATNCTGDYQFESNYCTDHSCYYYFSCTGDIIDCADDNLVEYTAEGYESCDWTVHS